MNGQAREDSRGDAADSLPAREAVLARQRHIRRRRATAIAVLAGLVLILVIALSGGGKPGMRPLAAGSPALPGASKPGAPSKPVSVPPPHVTSPGALALPVERVLRYTSYVQLAGHRRRDVALTFDDGPSPYTPQVLRILTTMHAPATFFVIGRSVRQYPQYVGSEVADGEEVGDHTETHPPLGHLPGPQQSAELTQAASAIEQAGAPAPVLMRPPYGSFDAATLGVLHSQRLLMVLWSADTSDYARPGVAKIAYTAISGAQPGAIILMHDGGGDRSETVAALPRIITRLRQRGFHLVTISQLLADDPPARGQPAPRPLSGF